jgi:hypothetical protein
MIVGGTDITFPVKNGVQLADVILHAARELWPEYVFQDAEEVELHENSDPDVWLYGTASTEFFVYRDREAADNWTRLGATSENQNLMLHFLVDTDPSSGRKRLTVVVGELAGDVAHFVRDLKDVLGLGTNLRFNTVAA